MLDENPASWLCARQQPGGALIWLTMVCVMLLALAYWLRFHRLDSELIIFGFYFTHLIAKASLAMAATKPLTEDAQNGALELIFTTPLSPERFLEGHLFGLFRQFGSPLLILMGLTLAWGIAGRYDLLEDHYQLFWMGAAFVLFDAITIAIYGSWMGFKLGRPGQAAMRTLIWIVLIPEILFPFLYKSAFPPFSFREGPTAVAWLAIDVVLVMKTLPKFKTLREQAAERFSASSGRE